MLRTDLKYKPKVLSEILNEKYETLQVQRLAWETYLDLHEEKMARESEILIVEYLANTFNGVTAQFNYVSKKITFLLDGDEICPEEKIELADAR